ncbi:alpha/beta hydrolase [Methylobacterium aquaticum]|nr:alpha/beta hydrolase [Methylobacterium aquaticum]
MAGGDWRGMDRATLSRAYDNSGAVPGSGAVMAALRERSAAVRATRSGELDIPYGAGARQRFDLFRCGRPGAPLLAFIHGGYWQRNDKGGFSALAEGPLARGLDVAMIGYTLCPAATMTALAAEIPAALTALRAHAAPPRLVVSGWSAGGHLAALAMACPDVDAGLAISGIFDLAPIRRTVLDDALHLTAEEVAALSPIRHLPGQAGPLTVAYGANELPELCRQSQVYQAAWAGTGLPGDLLPLPGDDHFTVLDQMIRPDGALTEAALRLATG